MNEVIIMPLVQINVLRINPYNEVMEYRIQLNNVIDGKFRHLPITERRGQTEKRIIKENL